MEYGYVMREKWSHEYEIMRYYGYVGRMLDSAACCMLRGVVFKCLFMC